MDVLKVDIPEIGVWICECGGTLLEKLKDSALIDIATSLEHVCFVKKISILCNKEGLATIQKDLQNNPKINRVLLAACSPRTSLKFPSEKVSQLLQECGLCSDFLEIANIREQCAWLTDSKEEATNCALDLLLMAYVRLKHTQKATHSIPIQKRALVIGGGSAGLQAAQSLANLDQEVVLVEKRSYLGGKLCQFPALFQCEGWPSYCTSLCIGPVQAKEILLNSKIHAYTQAEIVKIEKKNGNFLATIHKSPEFVDEEKCISCGKCAMVCPESTFSIYNQGLWKRKVIDKEFERALPDSYTLIESACTHCGECSQVCPTHAINLEAKKQTLTQEFGSVFIATGFEEYDLKNHPEYSTSFKNILSSIEFERFMEQGKKHAPDGELPERIVFVLCAGSRASEYKSGKGVPYCSKTCCSIAIKQAERFALLNPMAEITILYYRDIRAYERALEARYNKIRDMGIEFQNGELVSITKGEEGSLLLQISPPLEEDTLEHNQEKEIQQLEADLVVLAHAQIPEPSSHNLLAQLGVTSDQHGFPLENQPRILRPTETFVDRVYVIGASAGPKVIQQAVEQANAAVTKALPFLLKGEKQTSKFHSKISPEYCSNCRICETVCPHGAIQITDQGMQSDPAFCEGCGLCQAACPSHAIQLVNLTETQILEQASVAFRHHPEGEPKILTLLCYWCSYAGADLTASKGFKLPLNFRSIRIRCSSSVNTGLIMEIFKKGIDGILIAGCPHGSCHHRWGNYLVDKRVALLKSLFKQMGLSEKRVRFEYIGVPQSELFVKTLDSMTKTLKKLGPNPLRKISSTIL